MNTTVWLLQGNCFKVVEHECHCIVLTRKLFQSCGISTPLYGSYKEIDSKLRNLNTIIRKLQRNCFKNAEYDYCCVVVKRKLSQSCGI